MNEPDGYYWVRVQADDGDWRVLERRNGSWLQHPPVSFIVEVGDRLAPPAAYPTATHFTDDPAAPRPSAWVPEADPVRIAILGKALEEHGECTKALARCVIQGIAERDPASGEPNALALHAEMADVAASHELVLELVYGEAARQGLDVEALRVAFAARVRRKLAHKRGWHAALHERNVPSPVEVPGGRFNPMATAPRDGTAVLLHRSVLALDSGRALVGWYAGEKIGVHGWRVSSENGGSAAIYSENTFDGWLPMSEARR